MEEARSLRAVIYEAGGEEFPGGGVGRREIGGDGRRILDGEAYSHGG